jgi:hypothetical protein
VLVPPEEDAPFIKIAGNVVDEIVALGKFVPGISDPELREMDSAPFTIDLIAWIIEGKTIALRFAREPYFSASATQGYHHQSCEEAFWRTLIGDRTAAIHPAPMTCAVQYATLEWWFGISAGSDSIPPYKQMDLPESERTIPRETPLERHKEACTFMFHLGTGSLGRPLAVTKTGLLAIVPPKTQRGDLVSVIWGAQTPYILRAHQMRIAGEQCWELVGACFVHGLMNGEGLEENGSMFTLV